MDVLHELRKVGRSYPARAEPIPVAIEGLGQIGHIENRRQLYLNSALDHHVRMILREEDLAERAARDVSNGLFGAGELLSLAAHGTDSRDAIRTIKSMQSAIASWSELMTARAASKYYTYLGVKANIGTVASAWFSFLSAGGNPEAMTFSAIPGPAAKTATAAGAIPLPVALGASEDLYLTNFGVNHAVGTNIVMLVDVLTANGSILTSIVTSQNVSTTVLPRWTGGAGVMMTMEVTVLPGASTGIPTVRVNYTDQGGNAAQDTGTISIGLTSPSIARMLPNQDGPLIRLASDDYGVQSVQQVTFSISAGGAGGSYALVQYKPLLMVPTVATNVFYERSQQTQTGGIRKLTSVPQGSLPFLGTFGLCSTTSVGAMTQLFETIWG